MIVNIAAQCNSKQENCMQDRQTTIICAGPNLNKAQLSCIAI